MQPRQYMMPHAFSPPAEKTWDVEREPRFKLHWFPESPFHVQWVQSRNRAHTSAHLWVFTCAMFPSTQSQLREDTPP